MDMKDLTVRQAPPLPIAAAFPVELTAGEPLLPPARAKFFLRDFALRFALRPKPRPKPAKTDPQKHNSKAMGSMTQ